MIKYIRLFKYDIQEVLMKIDEYFQLLLEGKEQEAEVNITDGQAHPIRRNKSS